MHYPHDQDYQKQVKAPAKPFVLPLLCVEQSQAMEAYLTGRNLDFGIAKDNGWYPTVHRREPGVVIRSISRSLPGLGFYQVRFFSESFYLRYDSPKGNRLDALGVVKGRGSSKTLVVCEGPMDALAAAGVPGCDGVCTFGANPSQAQLDHLDHVTRDYPSVIICPDKDAPEFAGKVVLACPNVKRIGMMEAENVKDFAKLCPEGRRLLVKAMLKLWQKS